MNKNSYKLYIFLAGIFSFIIFGSYQLLSQTYAAPVVETSSNAAGIEKSAYFAGGCFWCTESDFEKVEGVREAVSGYTGGHVPNPTYQNVSSGGTGHVETVKVIYNPDEVSYERLLDVFWRHVDPTDGGGQFVDRGSQYRSAIFYSNDVERKMVENAKAKLEDSGKFTDPVATDILPLGIFYPAEEYHQDYYKKNSLRYRFYRSRSGRDQFLEKTWPGPDGLPGKSEMPGSMNKGETIKSPESGKYNEETLRKRLTPLQYRVVRENGTEPPFDNAYWDSHEPGIFVDIVSGEPLFSSSDKFKSGTGWPSFTHPLEPDHIVEKKDRSLFMTRIEVRSKNGDSHLGHVFADGPAPTGLRYCINSAALRFVHRDALEKEGYGQYLSLFQ